MHITTPHFGSYRSPAQALDAPSRRPASLNTNNVSTATDLAPIASTPPTFNSDTVANNILSFVQHRLAQAAQQGASPDQLAALLAQARSGATAGFDQAVTQLKGSGSFDEALSSGVSSALQKVDKGFDALAKQFGVVADSAASSASPATTPASIAPANALTQLAANYSASFSSSQSVDLIVKTADGDTVHLQLGVNNQQSASASYQANNNGQQFTISSSQKSSAGLSVSVDGNLDAGELQALNDLLGKVGDLANTFFGGDAAGALQQAGALDFSNPELSSLALNLHSAVTSKAQVAAYQQVQSLGNNTQGSNTFGNNGAAPATGLVDLAGALSALLPKASLADNPANLLQQFLAAHIGATNQQNNPLLVFANRLLTSLGATGSAAPAANTASNPTAATTAV